MISTCVKRPLVLAIVLAALGNGVGAAQEKQAPEQDLKAAFQKMTQGKLTKKEMGNLASGLADQVCQAAHPTSQNPDLLEYRITPQQDGSMQVSMAVEYFGFLRSKRYTATIFLHFVPNEDTWRLHQLRFVDGNNKIPPNEKNLGRLRQDLNRMLEK